MLIVINKEKYTKHKCKMLTIYSHLPLKTLLIKSPAIKLVINKSLNQIIDKKVSKCSN